MAAYIQHLKQDDTGNIVYPITKASAVYMNDNSTTVQNAITMLDYKNTYVTTIATLNTALLNVTAQHSIMVTVQGTAVTRVLAGNSSLSVANAQVWFTRQSGTVYEYLMILQGTGAQYTGIYNPNTSAASSIVVQPTRSEIDTLNSNLAKYRITYNATYSVSGLVYNGPSISQALDAIAAKGVGRYFVEVLSNASYSDSYNSLTSSNLTMIVDVVSTSYINVFAVTVGNSYGVTLYRAKSSSWGNWIKQPIRDEIDALNNSITNLGAITTKDVTNATLPSATFVTLTSMTLSPGIYILTGNVNFDQNPSGIRIAMIETEETSTNNQANSTLATGRATLEYTRMIGIQSQTTLYLRGYQNSGSTMSSVGAVLKAVKIK